MSLLHNPALLSLAMGSGLLTVWTAGGLGAALVAAACIDLGLTLLQRQREAAPQRKDV